MVGQRFVEHPDVAKVVFTGSTEVGRQIMAGCSAQLKPVTLELGGKSANVVFADPTWSKPRPPRPMPSSTMPARTVAPAHGSWSSGRSTTDSWSCSRAAVRGVVVSDPSDDKAEMGPLISAGHRQRVQSYLTDESIVAFRGQAPDGAGFWFPPTVLTPSDRRDPVLHEEIFGPVVAVVPFTDEADAIRLANDSAFGLSGSIWTRDVGKALRVSRGIESGNLSVNSHSSVRYWTPFGGFKSSGLGRELGPDAPYAFTETKNVFISTND